MFIAIDSENTAKHDGSMTDIALAKSETAGYHTANAWVFVDATSGDVLAIIFDVPNNEIDRNPNELAD